jgi:hypothetical protein
MRDLLSVSPFALEFNAFCARTTSLGLWEERRLAFPHMTDCIDTYTTVTLAVQIRTLPRILKALS